MESRKQGSKGGSLSRLVMPRHLRIFSEIIDIRLDHDITIWKLSSIRYSLIEGRAYFSPHETLDMHVGAFACPRGRSIFFNAKAFVFYKLVKARSQLAFAKGMDLCFLPWQKRCSHYVRKSQYLSHRNTDACHSSIRRTIGCGAFHSTCIRNKINLSKCYKS